MSVTFDTNVWLSALLWDGSVAQKLLFELIQQDVPIFTSLSILEEVRNTLQKDFDYHKNECDIIITAILKVSIIITPREKICVVTNDPDDNKIVECAVGSHSNYIISYDNHLLILKKFQNIKIITPEYARKIELR